MDDIAQAIGRLEGKVDLIVTGMTRHFDDDDKRFEATDKKIEHVSDRVNKLKYHWGYAAGAAAVVTFLISNYGVVSGLLSVLPK